MQKYYSMNYDYNLLKSSFAKEKIFKTDKRFYL